jgi:hypothetical protein
VISCVEPGDRASGVSQRSNGPACYYGNVVSNDSTLRDVRHGDPQRGGIWARRIGLTILLVAVVLGATGLFGVRSRTNSVSANGYSLRVTYPLIARSGLDVPWRAQVDHAGGFPNGLTLAVSTDYFRMFETQGFFPDADSVTNDGKFVYFTFDHPHGSTFLVDYDAYIQPASQIGKSATVRVLVKGNPVVSTTLRTWLLP